MKNRIVIAVALLLFAAGVSFAQSVAKSQAFVVIGTDAATPTQITNATFTVKSCTIVGKKGFQSTNTTAVSIGWASSNGSQWFTINPGQAYIVEFPDKRDFRLSDLYFDVESNNDGVVVSYE